MNRAATDQRKKTKGKCIVRASATSIHPEIKEFLEDPRGYSTEIEQIRTDKPVRNTIHLNGLSFYPTNLRKFITGDVKIHEICAREFRQPVPSFLGAGGPREFLAFVPQHVNVGIVVAGGTAPGTNTVIHWIVKRHVVGYGLTTGRIYGFLNGFRGLGQKGVNNVRPLRIEETETWLAKPGCELGMSRHREDIATMVETLKELKIDILYVIGGDGTLEAAHKIHQEIDRQKLRIVIAAVPKTIDNDIVWCWKTFGFETAVDAATHHIQSFHENIRTHGRIGLIVFYGGEAGFLAANSGLSSGVADAVLIPEERINLPSVFGYASRCVARKDPPLEDHALFVIAEGIAMKPPFWPLVAEEIYRRGKAAAPNIKPPEEGMDEELRRIFLGILYGQFKQIFGSTRHTPVSAEPRSLVNSVPPSARDIRYCQRLAFNAVDNALAGYTDFMSSYWLTEFVLVPLSLVAGRQKRIPLHGSFWANVRSTTGQPKW
jgi:6-phosphofructokinase 1